MPQAAREVRTTWTSEFGVARPTSVAYVPSESELLVAEPEPTVTEVVRLDFDEQSKGTVELPPVADASTVAYDPKTNELTAVNDGEVVAATGAAIKTRRPAVRRNAIGDLSVQDAKGSTFDPVTGTWYVLDAPRKTVVRVTNRRAANRTVTRIPLALSSDSLRGLAFNPNDGLLYVGSPSERAVHAVDQTGVAQKTYDLSALGLRNPGGMTFAPSADSTDPAGRQSLFIAQAGDTQSLGGVTEVTLAAVAALANVTATHVQTIAVSGFTPGSPDPSGIAYLPGPDRMHIVDSEVEEIDRRGLPRREHVATHEVRRPDRHRNHVPAIFEGADRCCARSGVQHPLHLRRQRRRIHVVKPGPDGLFGNADDVLAFVNTFALGSDDSEDPRSTPSPAICSSPTRSTPRSTGSTRSTGCSVTATTR